MGTHKYTHPPLQFPHFSQQTHIHKRLHTQRHKHMMDTIQMMCSHTSTNENGEQILITAADAHVAQPG